MIERRCSFFVVTSGNPAREVEAHLVAEDAQRAGAGAVTLLVPVVEDALDQVEVLPHAPDSSSRPGLSDRL